MTNTTALTYEYSIRSGWNASFSSVAGAVFTIESDKLTLTSTSAAFTAYKIGDLIRLIVPNLGLETRPIRSITSSTQCVLMRSLYSAGTASTAATLAMWNPEREGVYPPKGSFQKYSKFYELGDGVTMGGGWSLITWHLDFMRKQERYWYNQWAAHPGYAAGGTSDRVTVWTRTGEVQNFYDSADTSSQWALYEAVMVWPEQEEFAPGSRRMAADIKLKALRTV